MLSYKTGTYASTGLPASADAQGFYLPDAVIEPLVETLHQTQPQLFDTLPDMPGQMPVIKDPHIPYAKSKEVILAALAGFDPALAHKAQEIFDAGFDTAIQKNFIEDLKEPSLTVDASRWRLQEVTPENLRIMRCVEGQSAATDLSPANPNAKAVIQMQYDNTINSTIYLAHELGHAMADDFIRDGHGNKFGNNPRHMDEFQAYFVQNIVYDALRKSPDAAIARAAQEHFNETMSRNIQLIPVAIAAVDAQQARESKYIRTAEDKQHDDTIARLHSRPVSILLAAGLVAQLQGQPVEERHKVGAAVLGKNGPQNISDVLAAAGIEDRAAMQKLAHRALQSATAMPAAFRTTAPAVQSRFKAGPAV